MYKRKNMSVDPMSIVGGGIGIANSLVNAIKGIKQMKDGKKIQEKLDVQGRPILDTPEAFNEIEGLVRSNYLDPRLTGETRIKDSIKAREANKIQTIQDTASSGADALFAYGLANANTDNSLFNVDMKAYEQQQNDYNKLLSTLGQKANYEEKQFDFNVVQPFMQSAEQAKALIAAGEQNRNNAFENMAGYATSAFSGMAGGSKDDRMTRGSKDNRMARGSKDNRNKFHTEQVNARTTPSTGGAAIFNPIEIQNDVNQSGMNTQANVSAANGVVNDSNMAQIQQLLQLLNENPWFSK